MFHHYASPFFEKVYGINSSPPVSGLFRLAKRFYILEVGAFCFSLLSYQTLKSNIKNLPLKAIPPGPH
jgi:hypothetical protein